MIEKNNIKNIKIPFWGNIFNGRKKIDADIINILRAVPLFSTLKKYELRTISKIVYQRTYLKDEFLFKEGNPGSGMFMIKEGAISIEKETENGDIINLANLTLGDFVGELSLLNDADRSASAKCLDKTKVVVLFRHDLFDLIDKEPILGSKILKELAVMTGERLRETNKTLLYYKRLAEAKNG